MTNPDGSPKTPETKLDTTIDATKNPDGSPKTPDAKPPADPKAVPEKYEFIPPEGYTLDAKAIEAATPIFKELGLTQDQAQKLFAFQAARDVEIAKTPTKAVEDMHAEWRTKTATDPDLAKAVNADKTGLEAVRLDITRAKSILEPGLLKEFNEAMDFTGIGDHPAFVKAFWQFSKYITEGKHVGGGGPSPLGQKAPGAADRPTAGKALFPNLP